jgi:tetratricopeptide (TPR) repeat protein
MSDADLMEALEEGLASGAIEEIPLSTDRYRFSHALIKETLYDEISPAHRPRHHARVGDVLERLHLSGAETNVSLLAHHYARAARSGRAAQAVAWAMRAAETAESLLAYEEAAGFYQMALDALRHDESADEKLRCRLLVAAARATSKSGHVTETIELARRGAECARRIGDTEGLVDACRAIDYIVANLGLGGSEALPLLEEAITALADEDSPTRAALLGALTRACYSAGLPQRAEATMHESLAMARRVGDPKALVSALRARLYARQPADDIDERLSAAQEMLRLAEVLGDREAQREAHDMCFYDLVEKGEVAAADDHLMRAGRIGQAIRQPFHAHNHLIYRTMRAILEGRYGEGEALAREALEAGQRVRRDSAEGIFGMQMFTIRRDQGRLRELAGALTAFTRERPMSATWRPGLALMYAELGRAAEARSELHHLARDDYAAIPRDVLWPCCLAYLIEVADFLQDTAQAARLYALMRPYDGHALIVGSCVACLGASSYYLGLMARCLGRRNQAVTHFEEAIALDERMGARPWRARAELRLGTLLVERGTTGRGRELIASALRSARELGMASLVEQAGAAQGALH